MGKPTGFMEYERQDKPAESPKERIKHFREFHTPLSKEEQESHTPKIKHLGATVIILKKVCGIRGNA